MTRSAEITREPTGRDLLLERILDMKAASARFIDAGGSDPAAGIVNERVETLIEIRHLARDGLAWSATAVGATPPDKVLLAIFSIGCAHLELAINAVLDQAFRVAQVSYHALIDVPSHPDDAADQQALVSEAGGAFAVIDGLEEVVRGNMDPGPLLH